MKKKILLVVVFILALILVVLAWFLYSTGVSIEGKIQNSITMDPVSGAVVRIGNNTYKTDDQGIFTAYTSVFPKSSIIIEKEGYKPFEKKITFSGILDKKEYDIVLEPLSFVNILNNAQTNLGSYSSYIFKSSWKQQIDTPQQTITYMKFLRNHDGVVYFKILTDDKKGDAVSSKEIITTGEKIYYKTLKDKNWTSFSASQIRGTEMQKPEDILFLFLGDSNPGEFQEEETETWFLHDDGSISSEPKEGEEVKPYALHVFKASWAKGKTEQYVFLYLNQDYHVVSGKLQIIAPEGLYTEKPGRMNKQEIQFSIENINKSVVINIPEIPE